VGFYNLRRRHSGIEYLPPIDYERRHHAMIAVPGDPQPAAVLAAVKHASRRLRRSLTAAARGHSTIPEHSWCRNDWKTGGQHALPSAIMNPNSHPSTKAG
jgi:hypothetical protein